MEEHPVDQAIQAEDMLAVTVVVPQRMVDIKQPEAMLLQVQVLVPVQVG